MKNIKKISFAFVCLFLFIVSLPLSVSANAPMPADHLTVAISDIPKEAVYADLLIQINTDDSNYVDFQPNDFADDISNVKEIADYSSDGYRSFTFHYKNAKSNIKLEYYYDDFYCVNFCNGSEYQDYLTQYEDLLQNYRDIKIAILDKNYKIITVSDAAKLPKEKDLFVFDGDVYYNASEGSVTVEERVNVYYVVFALFYSGVMILLSVGTEFVIALLFTFKGKQLLPILIVNVCTQVVMRALYIMLPFTYLFETIILEMLVYFVEFFVYKRCFKQTTTAKILLYTIVANTASLFLGVVFDGLILG